MYVYVYFVFGHNDELGRYFFFGKNVKKKSVCEGFLDLFDGFYEYRVKLGQVFYKSKKNVS